MRFVGGERGLPRRCKLRETLVQNRAVLERRVHALSQERDHGMTGITQQHDFAADVPWAAADGEERAGWVFEEIGRQGRQQR